MPKGILERLSEGVVLGDGGYLLELERRGYVQAGPFVPEVSLTRPEALAELHREFVHAGAEVIQTLTFYASEDKLATVGLEGRVDPEDAASHRHVREMFDRQLATMTDGGVDFVIAETFNWLGEALVAAEAIKDAGLPAMVTMAPDNDPNSFEGHTPGECVKRLAEAGVEIVGVNCLRAPEHTLPVMEEMRGAVSDVYLAAQPVAFHGHDHQPNFVSLPEFPYELEKIQLPRAAMADFAVKAREMGFDYIGSCCGSVAAHVRAMAEALGKRSGEEREWRTPTDKPMSGYELHRTQNG
jgi:betaine-homocysteine S-methyltransferase